MAKQRQIVALATGRGQGGNYRALEASLLGIEGYAKNLPDGRVEVVGEGDESQLRRFIERLREGPPFARVAEVSFRWEEPTGVYRGFEQIL